MQYEWLSDYCLQKPGVIKDYKDEWEAFRYLIGDKMFVMVGEDNTGKPIITLKLEPLRGEIVRQQYTGSVTPGYYMNKVHWNSVYFEGTVPDDELKSMLDESYLIVLNSLPKRLQAEIQAQA